MAGSEYDKFLSNGVREQKMEVANPECCMSCCCNSVFKHKGLQYHGDRDPKVNNTPTYCQGL